jgi:phosphoribosylglycinamide formyltransferase-1
VPTPLRIAVLISGSGRTLKNILDLAAEKRLPVDVRLVASSSAKAGGLEFARAAGIPAEVFDRRRFDSDRTYGDAIFAACRNAGVDYVVMAGFLKLAPVPDDFAGRVVNIHPSLIPAFCGHGMYGHRVHQAVLDAGAKVTGVTIHFVDNDTTDTLAARVFEAEKEAYPHVLRLLAAGRIQLDGRRVRLLPGERSLGPAIE